MKGLVRLAHSLGERRGAWSALLATQGGAGHLSNRAQAAEVSAAANGGGSSGNNGGGGASPVLQAASRPSPPSRLDKLRERFRARARCSDAFGAEQYLRQYIQEGGEPQHWMLPMLLNTYGKLRQADKAWAIYQQLLRQQGRQQAQQEQQQGQLGQQAQQKPQAQQQQQQGRQQARQHAQQQERHGQRPAAGTEPAAAGAPLAEGEGDEGAAGSSGCAASGGAEGGPAWQARLAQRQARLAAEAEKFVRELALDAFPLSDYAYSTIITALSRAEHPPYDLPPRYAAMAADAFREMWGRGVQPNVVVWHSLMSCQVSGAGWTRQAGLAPCCLRLSVPITRLACISGPAPGLR
ncbi:hypothetical protein ABPG75_011023 [Micractinium tetrahymenae]